MRAPDTSTIACNRTRASRDNSHVLQAQQDCNIYTGDRDRSGGGGGEQQADIRHGKAVHRAGKAERFWWVHALLKACMPQHSCRIKALSSQVDIGGAS